MVWSCYATIGGHFPEPVRLNKTVGRLATADRRRLRHGRLAVSAGETRGDPRAIDGPWMTEALETPPASPAMRP